MCALNSTFCQHAAVVSRMNMIGTIVTLQKGVIESIEKVQKEPQS